MTKTTRRGKRRPKPLSQPAMLMFGDLQSVQLEKLIRKLTLDDVLIQPPWRLEYVYLARGFAHYRLLHEGRVIGIRDVTSHKLLPAIHRGLAAYLAQCGARPELALTMKAALANVDMDEELDEQKEHRVDPLFLFLGEKRKGRRATDEVRVYTLSVG